MNRLPATDPLTKLKRALFGKSRPERQPNPEIEAKAEAKRQRKRVRNLELESRKAS